MAFAEVASKRASGTLSGDSGTIAFPGGGVSAGDICVVAGAMWQSDGTLTVEDTLGTTYSITYSSVIGSIINFLAWGVAPSTGANTVTLNPGGASADASFSIDAFTGAAPALDVNGGSSTGSGTTASDVITTLTANALILGVMSHIHGTTGLTPTGSYTQIGENEDNSSTQCHNAVFRIATTATAYTVDWTIGGTVDWVAQTLALKETGGGGRVSKNIRAWPLGMDLGMGLGMPG